MKQIQSLLPARTFVTSYLKRNKNATLIALFKNVRKLESISYIGDWPLLAEIINVCSENNKFFTKEQIVKVTRLSTDSLLKAQRIDSKLIAILSSKDDLKAKISANK